MVAEEIENINKLILWDPIINGSNYMRQMLRINIATQSAVYKEVRFNSEALIQQMKEGKTVNIDGYEVAWELFRQVQKADLLGGKKRFDGRTLITQISRKESKYLNNIEALANLYSKGDLCLAIEKPFWKEIRAYYSRADNLFLATINWLNR